MRGFTAVAIRAVLASALAVAAQSQALAQAPPPPPGVPPVIPMPAPAPGPGPGAAPEPPGCAPMGLFRAVMRYVTPGLMAADRRAQPRTLYRQGATLLRSEELPDPVRGDQAVVIIAEPDIWVLNLTTRKGRHAVDPGPQLEVRAPILPVSAGMPAPFRTLEFGCEAQFVAAYAPRQERTVPWGATTAVLHTVSLGDQSVAILMDQRRNEPLLISYLRQGQPLMVLRYDDYRLGLPERPGLFAPPKTFQISEGQGEPPPRPLD